MSATECISMTASSGTLSATGILSSNLGFPRIGRYRELKQTLENFWSGAIGPQELHKTAAALRARHWYAQQKAGIDHVPSNDFSFYDQMLDTIVMLGAVPKRFGHQGGVTMVS